MKIKGECKCGKRFYEPDRKEWCFWSTAVAPGEIVPTMGHYCMHCGWFLSADGFAYEMVRADKMARARDAAIELLTTLRDGEVGKAMIARERNAVKWVIALLEGSAEEAADGAAE